MRSVGPLAILLFANAMHAQAAPIDFSSTPAMQATCAESRTKGPAQIRRDDDKVAYVICGGIDLVMDTGRWARKRFSDQRLDDANVRQSIRAKAEEMLGKLKTSRQLLESVHATKPLFTLQPGEWELDLDGDGTITPFEKHFFWVAKRGNDQIAAFSGMSSPEQ